MENAGSAPMSRLTCARKSAKRPHLSQLNPLWVALVLGLSLMGCSSSPNHGASLGVGDAGTEKPPPTVGACDTPAQGCECETPDEVVDCGQVERLSGDYVSCSMGRRTCSDGKWGACIGDSVATLHVPASDRRTQALGTGGACLDNPCDPYCRVVIDNAVDLPLPDGGAFSNAGGLHLVPHQQAAGAGTCAALAVTPTPQTVTVTGFGTTALKAEYFLGIDKNAGQISPAWTPAVTATAANINLSSGDGRSDQATLPDNNYSIRWTGSIAPPISGPYTLCLSSDDGGRIWIDGNLLVNAWYDQSGTELHCTAPLSWSANARHSIRVEYYQALGGITAILYWSSPAIPQQVVPSSAFVQSSALLTDVIPQFGVTVSPVGCLPSAPMPAWTLDRLDLAAIDATGKVGLISPVAGPINATAYLGPLSATGLLNVKVDVAEVAGAPAGSVTAFQGAVGAADTAKVLYPYDQTVLPIGLSPPRIQWDNAGNAASAVKVTLRYPATGAATFNWSQITDESTPPQATIPSQVWKAFEQTAKGQTAGISLQRIVGGQLKQPIARSITFSSAPVRGKIYYTQYHRSPATQGDANEMVVDPGSAAAAQPAFGATDGCPVCHSLSANGTLFATSSRTGLEGGGVKPYSPTLGGISSVNSSTGMLTPFSDFIGGTARNTYTAGSEDWRGFAWSPLTPTGSYALVANNIWGNTKQNLVGIDGNAHKVNTGTSMLSGSSGTGLLAQYTDSTNKIWKRIDPQINFDFGSNSPGGLIATDYSVKRTGRIAAYFTETYKFEVVSAGSGDTFRLIVGAADNGALAAAPVTLAAVPMTAGALVPFELDQLDAGGTSNVQLYWSSPSTPRALVPQSQLYPPAAEPMHGANVVYRDDATGTTASIIEPDIASNWGAHNPAVGIATDNWSSTWDAVIESPYTGNVALCVDSDDAVKLSIDGSATPLINSAVSFSGCSADQSWTAGGLHAVHIEHHEAAGGAFLILKYKYGTAATNVTEIVPSTNLTPNSAALPANGLTATYYDIDGFNVTLPASQTNPRAFQRIDPNIDFDWKAGRPNYSVISDDDTYSARWTGQIILPCSGVYQFQSNGNIDDGGRMWIDDQRVMSSWNWSPLYGAASLLSGTHDFKFDWYESGGNATARLQWKTPCAGSTGFVTIPSTAFTPTSNYSRNTGFVIDGGDNGNDSNYWVWDMTGTSPSDATALGTGIWGLAGTAMMVPSFAPNGSKLVFVDGDSAAGAGWRKGISTLDFDEANHLFKNRRLVANTWPLGDALKWPTFESDSRSVIFQSTVPGDACCRNPQSKYGYMGPTNYYEDPGRLWSVDTQAAAPTPVALAKLNSGEQPMDANKSYQPTMAPVAAGGYRWTVFTSTRPYGNTLNLPAVQQNFSDTSTYANATYVPLTNSADIQSQLWVSAIDDSPSAGADRSHPSFWLPSQSYAADSANGYVNERAYWVLDACHPAGTGSASNCEVDEDCCGGTSMPKTGACRLDAPLSNPPTRHCQVVPSDCVHANNSCSVASDCCTGLSCIGAVCIQPPTVVAFTAENYERIYKSDCPDGTKPVWRFFDWKTITPATGSKLEVFAETQADPTMFSTLPVAPLPVMTTGVLAVANISGPPVTVWTGNSVDQLLTAAMLKSQLYLKITVRFTPNTERTASPVLTDWRQSYSCVPAE